MHTSREFAKGLAKAKENDFLGAIEHFTIAIGEDKTNIEHYAERAVAYLNTKQYDLSMFDMNICIEIEPNNSYRYSCRAFLKSKMGEADGAIADYETAIMLDPDDAIAYNNLGLAQEQKGFRERAEKSFKRSNELIGYDPSKPRVAGEVAVTGADAVSDSVSFSNNLESKSVDLTKREIARQVFTNKKSFQEFLRFIRNGFKIKE